MKELFKDQEDKVLNITTEEDFEVLKQKKTKTSLPSTTTLRIAPDVTVQHTVNRLPVGKLGVTVQIALTFVERSWDCALQQPHSTALYSKTGQEARRV